MKTLHLTEKEIFELDIAVESYECFLLERIKTYIPRDQPINPTIQSFEESLAILDGVSKKLKAL